ncbi:hypothetical protein QQF54_01585 [Lelliottia sp. V106_10]|uniref:hypothetical protein n=1 Tax=Lelliottia wanjuensis TaxID=3050585 RepID=UPI00254BD463|nr:MULTISPECIES: hypothetical protein [unclassified Lelliottia]MDK9354837.1 hypothetical protein [Lelliottia sp. V106_16]MDK9372044.1 hypothetical protein [Lelliottia sp. V106_10]MDK9598681.1 hypothetical protein [Lelliottia sp. V106_5]
MDAAFVLPTELSPQSCKDVCELAWSVATRDDHRLGSAGRIAENWMDKGGDVYHRATRFIIRECLYMAVLSITSVFRRAPPFALLVRQLRLLAVMQYLGGWDLRQEATQYRALEVLYGTGAVVLPDRWHSRSLYNVIDDCQRTYRAARLFLFLYVAPVFPPLAPLR